MITQLFHFLDLHKIDIRVRHIAGQLNVLADALSQEGKIVPHEWSLHPLMLRDLWQVWERPPIDLFTTVHCEDADIHLSIP